jgi:hypothetical protein
MIYSSSFNACIDNLVPNISIPIINNNSDIKTIINNIETPIALSIIRENKESKPITVIEPKKDYNIPEKYFKYESWMLCLPKINGSDIDFSGGYCFKFKINDLHGIITAETLCNTNRLMKKNKSPQSPSKSSNRVRRNSLSSSSSSLQNHLSPN